MSAYKECSTYKELKMFRLPADISFPFPFFSARSFRQIRIENQEKKADRNLDPLGKVR